MAFCVWVYSIFTFDCVPSSLITHRGYTFHSLSSIDTAGSNQGATFLFRLSVIQIHIKFLLIPPPPRCVSRFVISTGDKMPHKHEQLIKSYGGKSRVVNKQQTIIIIIATFSFKRTITCENKAIHQDGDQSNYIIRMEMPKPSRELMKDRQDTV